MQELLNQADVERLGTEDIDRLAESLVGQPASVVAAAAVRVAGIVNAAKWDGGLARLLARLAEIESELPTVVG